MEKRIKTKKGYPMPLGVTKVDNFLNFSIALMDRECQLNLYQKGNKTPFLTIALTSENKVGNIFSIMIEDKFDFQCEYMYEVKGKELLDPYAKLITGREQWGEGTNDFRRVRGAISLETFDWNSDKPLLKKYHEMILYRLHVRGFTMHSSSKVAHNGTFLGIIEKIPYLKELGVNAIELLPIYDFEERLTRKRPYEHQNRYIDYQYKKPSARMEIPSLYESELEEKKKSIKDFHKVNYWGYSEEANYFAPKASYAYDKENPIRELKTMIQALHENDIEVILEFYFTKNTNQNLIVECLRYWLMEYHIDGFKINQEGVPLDYLRTDPLLGKTKLYTTNWNLNVWDNYDMVPEYKNIAEYNDGFLIDVRRFLKGDEEHVDKFMNRFRRNPRLNGVINYITNTNGFTLMDLVSYDIKHNEANCENNADGTDYNFSWNCGVEGKSRSKKVLKLRLKQIRNAFIFLLLSQGTPLILAGDEFGQTQKGNNNAYCQDNETAWLNWKLLDSNKEIYSFVKELIQIRKNHPILHMEDEPRIMDYISCGYPDLSYHGTKAWYPECSNYSRVLGILLCGHYVKIDRKKEDDFFYIAYNMHWEGHEFDIPKLPNNREWSLLLDTSDLMIGLNSQRKCKVEPRSIVVLIGKEKEVKSKDVH